MVSYVRIHWPACKRRNESLSRERNMTQSGCQTGRPW